MKGNLERKPFSTNVKIFENWNPQFLWTGKGILSQILDREKERGYVRYPRCSTIWAT